MKKIFLLLGMMVVLSLIGAGCTSPQSAVQPQTNPVPTLSLTPITTATLSPAVSTNLAGNWVLTRMAIQDGTVILTPSAEITLTVYADGTLVGYSGCNNYNAVYTLTGETLPKGNGIAIGPITSTKMYCQATSDQETTYYQILGDSAAYVVNENLLTITGKSGDALIYETPQTVVTQTQYPEPG